MGNAETKETLTTPKGGTQVKAVTPTKDTVATSPSPASTNKTTPSPPPSKKKLTPPMVLKTPISNRLKTGVDSRVKIHRSADLVPLSHKFNSLRKQLRTLIAATKKYHAATKEMDHSRMQVVEAVNEIGKKTAFKNVLEGDMATHKDLASETQEFLNLYQGKVIDYVVEWEHVVSSRVDKEQAKVTELHKKLMHYQAKVNGLRAKVNEKDIKERPVSFKLRDKMSRNEDKLDKAWEAHEVAASNLCDLLEEVVTYDWKDLAPLLLSMLNLELEYAKESSERCQSLPSVMQNIVDQMELSGLEYDQNVNLVKKADSDEEDIAVDEVDSDESASLKDEGPVDLDNEPAIELEEEEDSVESTDRTPDHEPEHDDDILTTPKPAKHPVSEEDTKSPTGVTHMFKSH